MTDLGWGLMMTAAGMGAVIALLAAMAGLLYLIGRLDRGRSAEPAGPRPPVRSEPDGDDLDADALAAIAIAVIAHAEVRRQQAAPAMRVHQPGSQLHQSRWVGIGRANTTRPWTRS